MKPFGLSRRLKPYRGPHPEKARRIESAVAMIRAILQSGDTIDKKHRHRFLSNCLWQLTEAEGYDKYDLRYRSRLSLEAFRKECRHEHVYRRKDLVRELIAHPENVESIARKAIACVVTIAEHKELDRVDRRFRQEDGWVRYQRAGIQVVDMWDGRIVPYDKRME